MTSTLSPVAPAEPLAPWVGGKRLLAKRIAARIDAVPHICYAEPFVGMGGVFLRRTSRPRSEVINDLNGDVANLFRVVREHPDELARQFEYRLASREEFQRLIDTPPGTLTDVQRAARFVQLQALSFGGTIAKTRGSYGTNAPHYPPKFRTERVTRLIAGAHARLQRVHIERMDWEKFIPRYDKDFTLFYIDPPYWGHENDYGKDLFSRDDFARMAEILAGLKGRFILSLNDRPEVREMFGAFAIEPVTTRYSANARAAKKAAELLISN